MLEAWSVVVPVILGEGLLCNWLSALREALGPNVIVCCITAVRTVGVLDLLDILSSDSMLRALVLRLAPRVFLSCTPYDACPPCSVVLCILGILLPARCFIS